MRIYDLTNCPYSNRNGSYGGAAGDKDGILIDGEEWIAKYPKATIGMHKNDKDMLYNVTRKVNIMMCCRMLYSQAYDMAGAFGCCPLAHFKIMKQS